MDKLEKQNFINEAKTIFTENKSVLVIYYQGLTVKEISDLRASLGEHNAKLRVVKNKLVKISLKGSPEEILSDHFKGPTAIAYSEDSVSAAKGIVNFAKRNEKIKILGGVVDKNLIDESGIKTLSDLPSIDELHAKILCVLNAPASKLASILQAPAGQLARVIKAYSSKN